MPTSPTFTFFPIADYHAHKQEIDEAVRRVLEGGHYVLGPEVAAFEAEFAAFTRVGHAVSVANGTDSIELILRALDLGPGAQVIVPSHTAVATASAVSRAGATPLFADIDPGTLTLCPRAVEALLESPSRQNIRAVIAVHIYGHPCDMEGLRQLAETRGIHLIEDAAQAHGASHRGRPVGSLAKAASFSFYPTKNLGAIGDGGCVTTNDATLAGRIRELRQYGWQRRYISETEGVNSRLDELQAAILRVKLQTLRDRIAKRRELASRYSEALDGVPGITVPRVAAHCQHAWHLYVIQCAKRDALMARLYDLGIPVALHYPAAIHQQPAYANHAARAPSLPATEAAVARILTLPLHPYLKTEALDFVCDAIRCHAD